MNESLQSESRWRAGQHSLCPREFVTWVLILKGPGCDCRTHADPGLETQTHTHIDQVRKPLLSQTSLDCQFPLSPPRPEHEEGIKGRALIIPSDSCLVSELLSSLSGSLLVGGGFQTRSPNLNPNVRCW